MVRHVQRFSFFDADKIGSAINYQDIGTALAKDGISMLTPLLKEAIKAKPPKVIIIDSFRVLHDLAESKSGMRKMLFELTGLLTSYETTTFLLGDYSDEDAKGTPEFAVVDSIVQLMRSGQSTRDERFLRVLKLRDSSYIEGLHGFRIANKGLDIYPRLVTPDATEADEYVVGEEQVPSGIDGLDKIIGGGLWKGSMTLLSGGTGTGKTTMALQFALEGLRQGVHSLYVNLQENPAQLARSVSNLTGGKMKTSELEMLYISPVEVQIDSIIVTLFAMIQENNTKRVVIDSIGDLAMAASDPQRLHDYLYALVQHFAIQGITAMFTLETGDAITGASSDSPLGRISYMSDNIFLLDLTQRPEPLREIRCVKTRGSEQDLSVHSFYIARDGIHIT
ncbi:MAG: ATPase domain-containing protein [Candidatus Melainabacteria bacterium]|nr:ATPase domain-containing protein [Candidatus Melainabacteria bacterium]